MKGKKKKNITTWGFIMSVLGAAVGLGSIWGFPNQMNKHGGIFLIPFFIALIVCALPILLIEINLGNKYRKNHVEIFKDLAKTPRTFFGFLQTAVVWIMGVFYSVLVAWSLLAIVMSFLPSLNQQGFFLNKLIGQTSNDVPQSFSQLGNISIWVLISLIMVWIITGVILLGGVVKGIDLANKIFIPSLFIMILMMMIYVLTLPGALDGLKTMFSFNSEKILTSSIWTDAFGQAFFMLSTCIGVIIIFSSHAPIGTSNTNKGLIIMVGTVIVALLTTCTVFGGIGAIAYNQHKTIDEVFISGPTLIFQVFPQVFAIITEQTHLPFLSHTLAFLFFLSVFFAGISSLIAIAEAVVNPLISCYGIKRYQALLIMIISSFMLGLIFCFNNSSPLIDGLAIWVTGIWQMIIGICELIGVILIWKCYDSLKEFNNQYSWVKWNKGFKYLCLILIPTIILINLVFALYQLINNIISNPFIFLTIGLTLGAITVLLFTLIFTFWNNIKIYFIKINNTLFKQKTKTEIIKVDTE
ncbi:sodium-dependent transporter [Spiroplasma endosymbiont of Tricholauxania praeusta]|uniref:sodium-dependent transporter n=1 Tax=Spiroplasma endosymbiont of Tricholauxania praeusta TaxID=3066296 RepID=UPI0030D1AEE8